MRGASASEAATPQRWVARALRRLARELAEALVALALPAAEARDGWGGGGEEKRGL